LRAITGVVGLTLPIVLLLAGVVDGHIESSISAYYYSKVGNLFTGASEPKMACELVCGPGRANLAFHHSHANAQHAGQCVL
jgi:hypothetical protein